MKFHVSIECESIGEFNWLAKQLGRETVAAVAPAAEPSDELDEAGLRPNGETAPATTAKSSRGRPKKEAAKPAAAPAQAPEQPAAAATPSNDLAIPSLQQLKEAITAAARKAMKKEGPTTILDLLPAFRDATGLDFIMNSQEEHRQALFELANQAGIPLV
jgi:hypothetical protein